MAKTTQDKLEKTLGFITSYQSEHGYPPTVREICMAIGVKSSATAQYYLDRLENMGKIRRRGNKNRAIELVALPTIKPLETPDFIEIPLVGKVAAGSPILATENIEGSISLPSYMFKRSNLNKELFALNVSGDSMVNAGILNGDVIIVRREQTANNGDIVVALIEDSATVKRFYKEKDIIRLQPENDYLSPIYVKELEILGVVVGLFRKF